MRLPDNLNYEVSGDRRSPAVLFLHGFMGSSADWRDVMGALGLTTEAYTIKGSARAVINTLDRLEVEHLVVAGYSMGGRLALYLALRYPERCAGLFLESASPGLESAGARAARRAADELKAKRLETGDFEAFLRDLGVPALVIAGGLDEKYVGISSCMASINPQVEPAAIPGAGHNVHDEATAEYVTLLGGFLDRLSLGLGEAEPVP